jgi:hypothetical protein
MRRTDDVFFFVLIDFLVQAFFFGFLLYAISQAGQAEQKRMRESEEQELERLKEATGISNLTQLTDDLSKLGPIEELKGTADFIEKMGGVEEVKKMHQILENAGGVDSLVGQLEKLRKLEEGFGKPPCDYTVVAGRKVARPIATVVADDRSIKFQSSTPELERMLEVLGTNFESVRDLQHLAFRKMFAPLSNQFPDCRHTLEFREVTRYVDARDAARFIFILQVIPAR